MCDLHVANTSQAYSIIQLAHIELSKKWRRSDKRGHGMRKQRQRVTPNGAAAVMRCDERTIEPNDDQIKKVECFEQCIHCLTQSIREDMMTR